MGVTVLQQFPCIENRTGAQTIDLLTKRVISLGAVQDGKFSVDCDTYSTIPALGPQKTLHVFNNSEHSASMFSILETGTKTIPLVADRLFEFLIKKMTMIFTPNPQTAQGAMGPKKTKFESKGPRYQIGDFLVKIGNVTMNHQTFKGVLVEVEYRPCCVPANCWELIREFLQGFLGSCVPNAPPNYLQARFNEIYQPIDTIHQYLEHFNLYRKTPGFR